MNRRILNPVLEKVRSADLAQLELEQRLQKKTANDSSPRPRRTTDHRAIIFSSGYYSSCMW
jgi:hypothetical protein